MKLLMHNKLYSIIFAVLLIMLCGCSDTAHERIDVSSSEEAVKEELSEFEKLEDKDYSGRTLKILCVDDSVFDADKAPDKVGAAIQKRYSLILSKYGVSTEIVCTDYEDAKRRLRSEEDFDIVSFLMRDIGGLAQDGLLLNLNALGNDFSKDIYSDSLYDTMNSCGKCYALYGSAVLQQRAQWVLYCNSALCEENRIYPDYLMRRGMWTWERLIRTAINADAQETPEYYKYGAFSENSKFLAAVWETGNAELISYTSDALPKVKSNTEILNVLALQLRSIARLANPIYYGAGSYANEKELFCNGRLIFLAAPLSDAGEIINSGVGYTIAPVPKMYSGAEGYRSFIDPDIAVGISVPVYHKDIEFASDMIEAIYAASYETVQSAYLEYCAYNCVSDRDSAERLKDIFSHYSSGKEYEYLNSSYSTNNATLGLLSRFVDSDADSFVPAYQEASDYFERFKETVYGQ